MLPSGHQIDCSWRKASRSVSAEMVRCRWAWLYEVDLEVATGYEPISLTGRPCWERPIRREWTDRSSARIGHRRGRGPTLWPLIRRRSRLRPTSRSCTRRRTARCSPKRQSSSPMPAMEPSSRHWRLACRSSAFRWAGIKRTTPSGCSGSEPACGQVRRRRLTRLRQRCRRFWITHTTHQRRAVSRPRSQRRPRTCRVLPTRPKISTELDPPELHSHPCHRSPASPATAWRRSRILQATRGTCPPRQRSGSPKALPKSAMSSNGSSSNGPSSLSIGHRRTGSRSTGHGGSPDVTPHAVWRHRFLGD